MDSIGIGSQRDTDFGGGDDIDGDLVVVEGFENGFEEAVSQQHAGSGHVDDA